MKLTTAKLKQIIKEELDSVINEAQPQISDEDIKAGEALAKSPLGQQMFDKLDKDPRVQKALQQVMKQAMNEDSWRDPDPDMEASLTVSGGMLGAAAVASNTGLVKAMAAGAAGKALLGTIGGVLGFTGAAAAIFLTPVLIGYMIDRMVHNAKKNKK